MAIWNERIRSKRLQKGITLAQIADKLGVTEATAQRYESGSIKNIPYEHMCAYGEILGCSPAYLMGWEKVDSNFSGKEASADVYKKFRQNIERRHEKPSEIQTIYEQLSTNNQDKVLRYSKNLLSNQQMEEELAAAHARTDITPTPEGQAHDNAIMDDDSEWE